MRNVTLLVIHCSATPPSIDIGAKEIRRWHTDPKPRGRGWSDIGYHYVIRRNGAVEEGRPVTRSGAHARGWNSRSIAICYVGGVDKDNEVKDTRTVAQTKALKALIAKLRADHPTIVSVAGHRDIPGVRKGCPSFNVLELIY